MSSPFWHKQDRGAHFAWQGEKPPSCLTNSQPRVDLALASSPQTSAGAPGWRRPPRGWERCSTLPPPGSAACTWERQKQRSSFFMTLVFWRSALCQLSDDLKHPVQYAEKHTCSVAQVLPIWQHTYLYFYCPISFICYSAHILCPDPSCSSLWGFFLLSPLKDFLGGSFSLSENQIVWYVILGYINKNRLDLTALVSELPMPNTQEFPGACALSSSRSGSV